LGVSEKTLIIMLRLEHVPARKIGREWRFSRTALISWLAAGDSIDYVRQNDRYQVSQDESGDSQVLFERIGDALSVVKTHGNNIRSILNELDRDIVVPESAALRTSYKQHREVEKLEFKIYWSLREDFKLDANGRFLSTQERAEDQE